MGQLRSDLSDRDLEIARLRQVAEDDARTIEGLRDTVGREAEQLLENEAQAERIERAQRALIQELREELGDATEVAEAVGGRLRVAEAELVDLRAIRDALLEPMLVQREGMTIAAEVIPADRHVGGDFFFVGDGPNGSTVMAIGDVVGHGLQAVRRSAFTRTALASVAAFSDDPGQLLRWVNVALVERIGQTAEFVTASCATYDPGSRLLRLASAGHHPALWLESGQELAGTRTGAALGLTRTITCTASSQRLDGGDGLLMYTDGLIEAKGAQMRYGIERLASTLRDRSALSPQDTIEVLKSDLRDFAGGQLADDVCFLVLRAE